MRVTLFFMILIGSSLTSISQVNFIKNDFDKAIKESKETGKPIFIDFYTTWCGPCKMLDKVTFQDAKISKYMNDNFVNLKIDCEKDYGIDLSMKYRITSYPSFAVIDHQNKLYAKDGGYNPDLDAFMKVLTNFKGKFDSGENLAGMSSDISMDFPAFYKGVFTGEIKYKDIDYNKVSDYLKNNDPNSEIFFAVLKRFFKAEYANYFNENLDEYLRLFGKNDVQNLAYRNVSIKFEESVEKKDYSIIKNEINSFCAKFGEDQKLYEDWYQGAFYRETGQWEQYIDYVSKDITNKDNESVNDLCWKLYESECPNDKLSKPVEWMAKVVKEEADNWMYIDTYAALLFRSGNMIEAKTQVEKAIAIAKKAGQDASGTVELLKKIEEACRNC